MDEIDIIIKRRQAKFMDQVARLVAEEYDALLAEIEAVRSVKSRDETAVAVRSKAERVNEAAEAEILGDQGQSGG
jgi:hypothetical protein